MKIIRRAVIGLMCVCLAAIGLAEDKDKDDEKQEHDTARAVLAKAKIDLSKAISVAQAKVPDGKPIYATTEEENDKLLFEVFLLIGDSVTEVEVDATTGEVAEVEENENDEVDDLPEAIKALAAAKITFAKAIETAKGKVEGGKPFEVEMELEDDKPIVEVEMLVGDKVKEVEIDAVTGAVLEIEDEKD